METDYPFKQHDIVPPEDLTLEKARALAEFLQSGTNPFARLAECRAAIEDGAVLFEVVVLDVDVEVSQHPVHDIRQQERLAVVFSAGIWRIRKFLRSVRTSQLFRISICVLRGFLPAYVSMTSHSMK